MMLETLKLDDLVMNEAGTFGRVVGFNRDYVRIEWDGGKPEPSTEADLKSSGVVLVEGVR